MIKRFHKINTGNPRTWAMETENQQAVTSEFKASWGCVRSFLKRSKKERKIKTMQVLWHLTQYQTEQSDVWPAVSEEEEQ